MQLSPPSYYFYNVLQFRLCYSFCIAEHSGAFEATLHIQVARPLSPLSLSDIQSALHPVATEGADTLVAAVPAPVQAAPLLRTHRHTHSNIHVTLEKESPGLMEKFPDEQELFPHHS